MDEWLKNYIEKMDSEISEIRRDVKELMAKENRRTGIAIAVSGIVTLVAQIIFAFIKT